CATDARGSGIDYW
nr:immunoglobulin heavy chain junction region [Macaca mulatta]